MSQRETIAIDIDDVLADNASGFVEFSNQRWGTNLTPDQYDEHWAKIWQIDNEETERRADIFHQSGVLRAYRHDDSALAVLRRLSQDFRLIVITSRRLQTKGDTVAWIHQHYPDIFTDETIHFAGIWDKVNDQSIALTKASLVDALGVDYLIDDQLKHCLAVAAAGKRSLLFGDYTWNQAVDLPGGIARVADWRAVEGYFYGA
jgi:5'(3')-deoxyribonucleotidase